MENIYALSPMQQAMLLHTVTRPADDTLTNQFCYELTAALDLPSFRRAWELLVKRHTSLRTAFVWGKKTGPMQVVRKQVELEFTEFDWTDLTPDLQAGKFEELREAERARQFEPSKPPLTRLAIAKVTDRKYLLMWCSHHLILDRWCISTVWSEVFSIYDSLVSDTATVLPPARPFSEYMAWVKRQPPAAAKQYWRSAMAGFRQPSFLTEKAPAIRSRLSFSHEMPSESVRQARDYARKSGVTLNILLQGALGIAMNRVSESQDIAFGVTVSGRPPDVVGIESMLGSFVSNIPVRVRLSPGTPITEWLRELQNMQHVRSPYEYVAPADVHAWSELAAAAALFDTLLVSLAPVEAPDSGSVDVREMGGQLQTALPLTIGVEEHSDVLRLQAIINAGQQMTIPAEQFLRVLAESIVTISTSGTETTLGELPDFFGTENLDAIKPADETDSTTVASETVSTAGGREMIDAQMMQDLLRIEWERALDDTGFELDDNFFEVGGNSLTAAAVHARVEGLVRLKIPLITLFQAPTLRAMSEALVSEEWPNVDNYVLPVRDGNPAIPPLFMIASPEVNSVGYALLARHLDIDRRAFVVQSPPTTKGISRLSPDALPGIAVEYLAEIRKLQPDGPYFLLGMCTGAQLAFEIAKQLRSAGELVPYVGIINTWAHYTVTRFYNLARVVSGCQYYLRRIGAIARMSPVERNATVKRISRRLMRKPPSESAEEATALTTLTNSKPVIAPGGADQVSNDRHDPWIQDYGWVRKDPGADKFPVSVTVYRTRRQQYWRTGDRDLGWGRHAAHTHVEDLASARHIEILREPQVCDLARLMRTQLLTEDSDMDNRGNNGRGQNAPDI